MKKITVLLFAASLAGCVAAGKKYDYQGTWVTIPVEADEKAGLVLVVEDRRSYVLSGNKPPSFVGLQRDGFGVPFDVTTRSGKPLTDLMLEAIEEGLSERGYIVFPVPDSKKTTDYVSAAADNHASRIVILEVLDWKSDVLIGITLTSDLQLSVLDASGNLLARSSSEYYGKIAPGSWASTDDNARNLAAEFSQTVEKLFSDEEVRRALEEAPVVPGLQARTGTGSKPDSSVAAIATGSAGLDTSTEGAVHDVTGVYNFYIDGSHGDFSRMYKKGRISLSQIGNRVTGTFEDGGKIDGTVEGRTITFDWFVQWMEGNGQWEITKNDRDLKGSWRRRHTNQNGDWVLYRDRAE